MRRGHPGIGGWRGENMRHFRPRSGGTTHFRPPRGYGLLGTPRFPPPGARFNEPPPFNSRADLGYNVPEHLDRNKYRLVNNQPSNQRPNRDHHVPRGNYPHSQRRHVDGGNYSQYQDSRNYHENIQPEPYLINSMGDIDQRQMVTPKPREPYGHHRFPVWNQNEKRSYYDERNPNKSYRPEIIEGKLPTSEYNIGHRPPASDHYGGNPGLAIDSNSFSRSVDDTVDLVRKRLMNRNEPQQNSGEQSNDQNLENQETRSHDSGNYQNTQEAPTKKRVQRQKQVKVNCDKMKNKIVHQLFKMDKDKIHKLMDNPNSSNKFEYAISSLITESQNSLNRHLRSVAEKSLTTSSDFINNDNNTIYEDTFMKQMQCLLDPQDTIILEDLKPLVMQELTKVLQLDNFYEQPQDIADGHNFYPTDEVQNYENTENYDIYSDIYPYEENDPHNYELQHPELNALQDVQKDYEFKTEPCEETLFERRPAKVHRSKSQERRFSMEQRRLSRISAENRSTENPYSVSDSVREQFRRSTDRKSFDEPSISEPLPIFDTNAEQLSEEEDPFADLDQQYHVAVDHNFIQSYDAASPQPSISSSRSKSPTSIKKETVTQLATPVNSFEIKKEIENQLINIAKSPLEIVSSIAEPVPQLSSSKELHIKQEHNVTPVKKPDKENRGTPAKVHDNNVNKALVINVAPESNSQHKDLEHRASNSETSIIKSSSSTSSRKRSLDQHPSHRKEKRKKSESNQESSQQILNKNIIINVNDCAAKKNEKCAETTKSIFNIFFPKDQHSKDSAPPKDIKTESTDKNYLEKYVKRKDQPSKESKPEESKKRHHSTSSSHSIVNPKGNSNTSNSSISTQTPKSDPKNKLKHIDMFVKQPRKSSMHQSHRNTALPSTTPDKVSKENKAKPSLSLKLNKINSKKFDTKETQTLDSKKNSRCSQTERTKLLTKPTQTDPVVFAKTGPKSTDAFERMKEIDLEIQVLLQEKFKLYSSLESKDPSQTLGMTVLNVNYEEDDRDQGVTLSESEDAIVADFTSIPVEELEQIAFESVQNETVVTPKGKKNQRQKVMERERTSSRSPSLRKNNKKGKGPNISLIELITDDGPLEDVISLDDLEHSPVRPKKKQTKQPTKAKNKLKKGNHLKKKNQQAYNSSEISGISIPDDVHLKECFIVLNRDEIENYFKIKPATFVRLDDDPAVIVETVPVFADNEIESINSAVDRAQTVQENDNNDSVTANDIHFDMLDVSEDIVIGEVCDVKSNDKSGDRVDMSLCEEIILDNSQSSMDEAPPVEPTHTDSQCKTYDFSTDESLRRDAYTITSNPDAVLALEFVENNNFLAACLDGNVYYYNSDGQLLTTLRGYNQAVTCLNIVREKYGITVYTGSLDSRIRYYDLESGMEKGPECNVLSPIQSMDRAWDTVFVGTRTGFVLQFECKNHMLIPVSTVKFSEQSILALRAIKEGPRKVLLVAAGSEDVTIKDAQTGLLLRTLSGPKMTVYSLLYEEGKVYCGTSSNQIHVFDYASSSHVTTHEGGKGVVCLRTKNGLLFAGCYDGCVYVYREAEPRPLAQLRGPGVMLLSLAVVGSKIIAGYKDRGLHIWKIPRTIEQEMIL